NFVVAVSVPNVPQGAPATARFTFSVYGDGRFRLNTGTAAMAPGDNPQRIVVPVSNYHTITIRVEPASIGATGYGQWLEPMFLKQ
ncbi:MAG TPA: NPCBM/NEW2 domain-containing protein, partial [Chthoniobacteraceae bacterium]|nr:NPCBM/NEW2 domain-containing protein [Chthoniobacteraceae bacterium]